MAQDNQNMGPTWPYLGPTWLYLGASLGPVSCAKMQVYLCTAYRPQLTVLNIESPLQL